MDSTKFLATVCFSWLCLNAPAKDMKRHTGHCTAVLNEREVCLEVSAVSSEPVSETLSSLSCKKVVEGPCRRKDFVCGYEVGLPPKRSQVDHAMRFRFFTSDAEMAFVFRMQCQEQVDNGKITGLVRPISRPKKAE